MQNAYYSCTFLARVNILFYNICIFFSLTFYSGAVPKECDGECPCPVIRTNEAAIFTGLITPTEQYPSATEAPFCSCPGNVYSPVCGVDGQVYDNPCLLACEWVVLFCSGVFWGVVFFGIFVCFFMYINSWSFVYLLINVYIIIFNSFKLLNLVKIHCFFKYIYEDDALWNNRIEQSTRVLYRKNFLGRYR